MIKTNETTLTAILSDLGVPGAEQKVRLMFGYMDLVLQRNEVMNLTAITDENEFIEKHFADSLAVYGRPELDKARRVVDIGAGAGFPGVPLAIACPDKEFLLIDSLRKRVDFITEACAILGIVNVRTLHARAEEAARSGDPARAANTTASQKTIARALAAPGDAAAGISRAAAQAACAANTTASQNRAPLRESFDLALCRAVGHLSTLCEYALPLLRVGGALYAYKSESQLHEIEESENARQLLGAIRDVEVFSNTLTPVAEEPAPADSSLHENLHPEPVAEEPASADSLLHQKSHPEPAAEELTAADPSLHKKTLPAAHLIIVVKKERSTPAEYPRRPGVPSKKSL